MKNKKKLIALSTLGAFAVLLLVLVFFTYIFQSISIINILIKSPEIIANNDDPPKNTHAKKQLDPRVSNNDSQIFLAEQENHKDIPTFDSLKENYQGENSGEIIFESGNKLESGNNNPDPLEDNFDLQANKEMHLHQLEEALTNRYDSEQLVNVLNQLAWLGDSDVLSALIDGYQKAKYDGDSSSEILKAISKIANPEVVYDLGDYMNNAIVEEDDTLLISVATALSNIGSEEATDMLIETLSETPENDITNLIITKTIANIRNTDVAPILVNMIEKKANGYEGAMEALLKLGDFGTEKIANLLVQDENIEYREKLLSVTETMPFDEETYYTINKLAELNEEFEDFFIDAGNNLQGDMADPQVQALDLKTQKTSIEIQLGPLSSTDDELAADLKELKKTNAPVAELESAAAMREQKLSQSEQKVTDLTNALDREKKGQDPLSAEFSTKADLVAELQQKLEATLSSRAELEKDIEKSKNEIGKLQGQLLDLKAQKASSDTQLGKLKSLNEELTADLEELDGAKERVAELEGVASMGGQKLTDLAKELDQEKQNTELLRAELSTKADLVAGLQQKLEASISSRAELENDIEKSKKEEIAELQNQLRELKAQQAPTESSAVIVDLGKKSTSESRSSGEQGESQSPADLIDWVFKRKGK